MAKLARIFTALGAVVALLGLLGLPVPADAAQAPVTITLLHHADYHAHPLPQFTEGQPDRGGIARAIGYIDAVKRASPNVLSLSGGDTLLPLNLWSDETKGEEWAWFNGGRIDVMAFGNHDFDYGQEVFERRRREIDYPIISANFVRKDTGQPYFLVDGKPYVVRHVGGVRVGILALAGSDFARLVPPRVMPPDTEFVDAIPVAQRLVRQLREAEQVDLVVVIGHEAREEDEALAAAVPGIDVIFGSHSHLKVPLTRLGGANGPLFISAYQYLTYLARLDLTVQAGRIVAYRGELVPIGAATPANPEIAARVDTLWRGIQARFPERFEVVGRAETLLDYEGINEGETVLGNLVSDVMRETARANLFVSTSSSFRASIPPGPITINDVREALPFNNTIVTVELTGAQVRQLVDYSLRRRGSDFFSQQSGLRYRIENGRAVDIQVLTDPANPASFAPLDEARTYLAATTNYQAGVAAGYKEIFAAGRNQVDTGRDVNETFIAWIRARGTVTGRTDGRIVVGAPGSVTTPATPAVPAAGATGGPALANPAQPRPPIQMPRTGGPVAPPYLVGVGLLLVLAGCAARRWGA